MREEIAQRDRDVKPELECVAYSMADAARAMGIGLTLFSEFVMSGRCRSFRVGRRRLIRKHDLQAFADSLYEESEGKR